MEGVKLGNAALAGFPSLKYLPFTASLGFHGVNVFQQDSRNESMVVSLSDSEKRTKIEYAKLLLNQRVHVGYPFLQEAKIVKVSDELFDYTMSEQGPQQVKAVEHSGNDIDQFHKKADRIEKWYSKRLGMLVGDVESLVQVEMLKGLKKLDDGSTVKEFAEMPGLETIHASQVVVGSVISEDMRFLEKAAVPIEEEFPDGTNAFFLGEYAFGRPVSVVGHEDGKAKCLIAITTARQVEFGRDLARQAQILSPYTPSYQVARSLNLNSLVLAKITSSFSVRVGDSRVNLGLNLKFEAKKLKVLGYSRKSGGGWEFSRAAVELIQQYMIKFPVFIAGIQNNPQGDMLPIAAYFGGDEEQAKTQVKEIQAWLKEIESKSFEKVPLEAEQLDSDIVKRIEQAADEALRSEPPPQNKTIGGVPRNGLLKPSDAQWRLGNQRFALGDRIIYVADSGKVPIASKGTVVGLTQTTRETWLDVVFDVSFMSGTSLGDRCSPFRGQTVPTWSVLNLSNKQVLASSKASANRQVNGSQSTPLTVDGYGLPGINGQSQLRPAQAPPALRGSWRGAVTAQTNDRGRMNGYAGRGHQTTVAMRNYSGSPANGNHAGSPNGAAWKRGGGYTPLDRGDVQAGVVPNNPNFRPQNHNSVPPPANLNMAPNPRGRGRGRGFAPRGRGTTNPSRGG
jgi:5'-3' exoribonuclease 1